MWDNVGMSRDVNSLKKALEIIPEIRKDFWENVLDNLIYNQAPLLDCCSNENFSFSSSTIILKRYFDTDLLGTYAAVGYQYKFFTLFETEYTGGMLNEDTFLLEIGYSDILTETLYITVYLGISKYFVVGSEIITDESGTRARMETIPFPYVGICLGYEF